MLEFDVTFENVTACLCCGAHDSQFNSYDQVEDSLLKEINRYIFKEGMAFPIIRNQRIHCNQCGLIFMSPRLSDASLSLLYHHWYKYAYDAIFVDENIIKDREKEFKNFHLKTVNRYFSQKGTLLDVGCGSGLFLSIAKQSGWKTHGIEFDKETAHKARSMYDINIHTGTLHDAVFELDFDAITLFDYLEHTKNPKKDLERLHGMLKEEGLLFIRLPNQDSLQSKFMKEKWVGYISNHLSYFNIKTLTYLLNSSGFRVKEHNCHNYITQYDLIKKSIRHILKKIGSKKIPGQDTISFPHPLETKTSKANQILNYVYSFLMEELDFIGGLFNKSNNLMVIAEKQ